MFRKIHNVMFFYETSLNKLAQEKEQSRNADFCSEFVI